MSTSSRERVGEDDPGSQNKKVGSNGASRAGVRTMDGRLKPGSGRPRPCNRLQKFSLPSGDDVIIPQTKPGSPKDVSSVKLGRDRSSVCTILPANSVRAAACRRSTTGTSELGLVLRSGGNSLSASSRPSCDASFAVSLNAVRERTDLRREEAGGLLGGGNRAAEIIARLNAVSVASGSSHATTRPATTKSSTSKTEASRDYLASTLRRSMASVQREMSGAGKQYLAGRTRTRRLTGAGQLFHNATYRRIVAPGRPGRANGNAAVYSGRAVIRETLLDSAAVARRRHLSGQAFEQHDADDEDEDADGDDAAARTDEVVSEKVSLKSPSVSTSGRSTPGNRSRNSRSGDVSERVDNNSARDRVGVSGGLAQGVASVEFNLPDAQSDSARSGQKSLAGKGSHVPLVRSASGDSGTGDDDYEIDEEEGEEGMGDDYPEVRLEDMLYVWDLNRDLKDLVHCRIRDLGMPKFLGMGIVNKGNVAPDIVLPEPGPIRVVEAELRQLVKTPAFHANRYK